MVKCWTLLSRSSRFSLMQIGVLLALFGVMEDVEGSLNRYMLPLQHDQWTSLYVLRGIDAAGALPKLHPVHCRSYTVVAKAECGGLGARGHDRGQQILGRA